MSLQPYTIEACESIDASVFSGDLLYDAAAMDELEAYLGRWQRAIAEHRQAEQSEPSNRPGN